MKNAVFWDVIACVCLKPTFRRSTGSKKKQMVRYPRRRHSSLNTYFYILYYDFVVARYKQRRRISKGRRFED
jgi:hypothetical protein